jgi:hypothetical protein
MTAPKKNKNKKEDVKTARVWRGGYFNQINHVSAK